MPEFGGFWKQRLIPALGYLDRYPAKTLAKPMIDSSGIIADGCTRIRRHHEAAVRIEIETKYTNQMVDSSWLLRRKLRKQIEVEINQRLDEIAPPNALY